MYTADTLSRAVDPKAELNAETEEDIRVYVDAIVKSMPVTSNKRNQIVEETKKDDQLQELLGIIRDGWPETKQQCPVRVREYWNIRSELSEADGIIFKGTKIVVPTSMRRFMLNKIHEGHLGIEKCKKRAREIIYWPRINTDITEMVLSCTSCLMSRPKQVNTRSVRGRKEDHKVKQKERFDKHARDLSKLKPGDHVILQDMKTNTWSKRGIVRSVQNRNRSYQIETETGEMRRRNRRHLRPVPRQQQAESIPLPTQDDFELDDTAEATEQPASEESSTTSSTRTRSGRVIKPPDRLNL